ncbi:MAG: hypothetical protein K0M56_01630 [Kaistella sp.]|nr:hypothetical protein [Kaistella sp.]
MDVLHVNTTYKVKNITVYELAGKRVDVRFNNNVIDVKNLQSGVTL